MSLTESIVEEAALNWFGEMGYSVAPGPKLAPGEHAAGTLTPALSQGKRESYGDVVLVGRLRSAEMEQEAVE
jgi:type I restriction enzyme R subunit